MAPGPSVVVLGLVTSDEVSGFAGYYWETELSYLKNFHSLVLDKVAALLVAIDKVKSTREADNIVAFTLEVVNLVTEVRGQSPEKDVCSV